MSATRWGNNRPLINIEEALELGLPPVVPHNRNFYADQQLALAIFNRGLEQYQLIPRTLDELNKYRQDIIADFKLALVQQIKYIWLHPQIWEHGLLAFRGVSTGDFRLDGLSQKQVEELMTNICPESRLTFLKMGWLVPAIQRVLDPQQFYGKAVNLYAIDADNFNVSSLTPSTLSAHYSSFSETTDYGLKGGVLTVGTLFDPGAAEWGKITGSLSSQTDLVVALNQIAGYIERLDSRLHLVEDTYISSIYSDDQSVGVNRDGHVVDLTVSSVGPTTSYVISPFKYSDNTENIVNWTATRTIGSEVSSITGSETLTSSISSFNVDFGDGDVHTFSVDWEYTEIPSVTSELYQAELGDVIKNVVFSADYTPRTAQGATAAWGFGTAGLPAIAQIASSLVYLESNGNMHPIYTVSGFSSSWDLTNVSWDSTALTLSLEQSEENEVLYLSSAGATFDSSLYDGHAIVYHGSKWVEISGTSIDTEYITAIKFTDAFSSTSSMEADFRIGTSDADTCFIFGVTFDAEYDEYNISMNSGPHGTQYDIWTKTDGWHSSFTTPEGIIWDLDTLTLTNTVPQKVTYSWEDYPPSSYNGSWLVLIGKGG